MLGAAENAGIGNPVRRKEDLRLITGKGSFSDDARLPDEVHAVFVRSPHAHARIRSLDTRRALALPGVIMVLTGKDLLADGLKPIPHKPLALHPAEPRLANRDGSPIFEGPHYPLAHDKARHVGDAVAVVIVIAALVASAALVLISDAALAQSYPARPIRLIVPFPPGGGTDVTARILVQALSDGPGWQAVVENRPGATGRIGTELVAKAAPDGYTLLLGTAGPNAILPGAYSKLPYDAVNDFVPISLIDSAGYALVVHPSLPVKSVKDLIALAGSKPGQITFASAGNLSVGHLAGEFFKQFAKVDMVHVAYKGGGPAVVATLSGETALYFGGPSVVHQAKAGRLRAVATTGAKRSRIFPDLPTIAETLPGYAIAQWVGVLAPAGTPKDIISTLYTTIVKAIGTAKVAQQFEAVGSERIGNSPEEFSAHIKAEIAKWGKVLKGTGVPLE